jgi:WD40 repeat protein
LADVQDAPGGKLLPHKGGVEAIALQPTGRWLVTAGSDGTTCLWDLRAPDPAAACRFVLRGHTKPVARLAISPDGRRLATGSLDETVRVWDLEAADPTAKSQVLPDFRPMLWPRGPIHGSIAFSANGRRLLTTFNEIRTVQGYNRGWRARIWDLTATAPAASGITVPGAVETPLTARDRDNSGPSARWVVTGQVQEHGTAARGIDLDADDLEAGTTRLSLRAPVRQTGEPLLPDISPDGRWLYARTGSKREDVYRLWDVKANQPEGAILFTHEFPAPARADGFSPDGRWLVAAFDAKPNNLHLWDLRTKDPEQHGLELRGHSDTVRELVFSPDGHWMATSADDSTVRLWNLRAKDPGASRVVLPKSANLVGFTPNGRRLITGDLESGLVHVLNLDAADPASASSALRVSEKAILGILISRDGRWLVTRDANKQAKLWSLKSFGAKK